MHEHTASVLKDLAEHGVAPEMVQVGNEIAAGMLWPLGRIGGKKPAEDEQTQFARLARLIGAGARAVREASTPQHPIQVVVHIHGGGKAGHPKWFLEKLHANPIDYDILALSFYPA